MHAKGVGPSPRPAPHQLLDGDGQQLQAIRVLQPAAVQAPRGLLQHARRHVAGQQVVQHGQRGGQLLE
jgi:hypothetical protein